MTGNIKKSLTRISFIIIIFSLKNYIPLRGVRGNQQDPVRNHQYSFLAMQTIKAKEVIERRRCKGKTGFL